MSETEEIKQRISVEELIGSYVPLKPAGRNLKGLCPFHGEKTPSFMVSPEKQIWHCFGCHEGGDIFSFYQKIEGVGFAEALEDLAKRAGVTLSQKKNTKSVQGEDRLYKIHELAAAYFIQALSASSGKEAREYLKTRNVTAESVERYKLGYSPQQWEALTDFLRSKGFTDPELIRSGLSVRGERGLYDRFRGRLIFPVSNPRGRVVGFAGRTLPGDERGAKYLNSPDSPIYHKGELLYGFEQARDAIRESKEAVLVEGNLDVILSAQAGIPNVVAASGTAFTAEQLKALSRLAEVVKLAFDPDAAGAQALERVAALPRPEKLSIRVIPLPPGRDPADVALEDPADWRRLVNKATYLYDYLFEAILARHPVQTAEGKRLASRELLKHLRTIPDEIEQAHYLKLLAERLGVREEDVRSALRRTPQTGALRQASSVASESEPAPAVLPEEDPLESHFLGLLLAYPVDYRTVFAEVPPDVFRSRELRALYSEFYERYNKTAPALGSTLPVSDLAPELREAAELLGLSAEYRLEGEQRSEQEVWETAGRLRQRYLKRIQQRLSEAIREAERRGDRKQVVALTQKFQRATETLRRPLAHRKQLDSKP